MEGQGEPPAPLMADRALKGALFQTVGGDYVLDAPGEVKEDSLEEGRWETRANLPTAQIKT